MISKSEFKLFRENIIAELKEKIANNPSDVENYRNLANYYIGCEDLNNAVLMYKEILKLDACDYQSLINIGSICYYRKMYLEAIENYNNAIKIEPNNYASYYNLGNVYAEIENFELAYSNYQKAIELKPEKADIYSALGCIVYQL